MKFWQWLAMFAFKQVQKRNRGAGRIVTELRMLRGKDVLLATQFPSHQDFGYVFAYPIIANGRHFNSIQCSSGYTEE